MKQRMEFSCPRCSGRTFGTTLLEGGKCERICHGRVSASWGNDQPCSFKWLSDDDYKYFRLITSFENKEEFAAENEAHKPKPQIAQDVRRLSKEKKKMITICQQNCLHLRGGESMGRANGKSGYFCHIEGSPLELKMTPKGYLLAICTKYSIETMVDADESE